MPYIDFGGGSNQTPVKKDNDSCSCDKCIHKYILSKDLFYCTVTGQINFCNNKSHLNCVFKSETAKVRKVVIAIYDIKDDGTLAWTGWTSIFLADKDKTDNNIVNLFYEKAIPDYNKRNPKIKDLCVVPIIVAEAVEDNFFKPIGTLIPFFILSDIIRNLNKNIDNLGALTDE